MWHRYSRRGDRASAGSRAYTAYLVVLFGAFFLAPALHAAGTSPALFSLSAPGAATSVSCAFTVTLCWSAQLAGRFWGPLVLQPFVLHVFTSTDLPPTAYLGGAARRRLRYAGTALLLASCAAAYLTTDLFDDLGTVLPAVAVAAGAGALGAVAWLWGQVRTPRDNLVLASAAGATALLVTLTGHRIPDAGTGGLWLVAVAAATTAVILARVAFRSLRTVDLARLARESSRASQAQTYVLTGTLHHALDLYRPEPRGFTSALFRPDGRLRGHVAQGAVRALRTPGRTSAAALLLLTGGALLAAGTAGGPALPLWAAGACCVYLGSGRVGETWRGLRDELTLPPLFGGRWRGTLARGLAWPAAAVTAGTLPGGGAAAATRWPQYDAHPADTALLAAATIVLVLGARFLREMKSNLPLSLLLPVMTPFGDLSGLLVVAWQFDGLVTVVLGTALLHAAPSAPVAAALAAAIATCCAWTGLRRTRSVW
ncbi:hypothetical protein KVH02_04070 [Streptomyces olivaceus]|uniref:Integral membrane protein n=1 Tax=Streptomyces olivaceus TaxID=47716 RepID=A0ABS7VXC6_STROV|nr:hypothetical protein [Streptomyces olivaceus]MBZ6093897.1 hypothetical protein [Streptomyces olivaceus]MBZ6115013.1 hypothetical protein [Streptomyces olivaceus]MBZ6150346.1 hypothetical protein [Streptomyces olivaceus]MBZ6198897.1 hypothetical protein [Streptomyces olivaceus]